MAKIKPLKQSALCQHFTDREIALFASAVEEIQMPKGQALLLPSQGLFLVSKGRIQASWEDSEKPANAGASPLVHVYEIGDFWGELAVFSRSHTTEKPVPLRLVTLEAAEVLFLSSENFADLLLNETSVALKFLENLFGHLQNRVLRLQPLLQKLMQA